MTTLLKFSVRATAAAALLSLGSTAFAAVAIDANIELNNDYRDGSAVAETNQGMSQNGRVEFNASGKAGANLFVAAKAAFLAKKDGTVGTDDMWIQLGSAAGDVKLGRFEAADLFPLPGDTLVNHAGNVYGTNTLRGRKDANVFHAAGTLNIGSGLSVELGVVQTNDGVNAKGVRPVLTYAAGPLTAKLGFEAGKYAPVGGAAANDVRGVGVSVGYDFGGFKLVGNVASGKQDKATREGQTAFGLIAAVGPLAVGFISAKNEAAVGDDKVQTIYASYAIPLFDIKGATITPAISASTLKTAAGVETSENSIRVRLNYAF